MQFLLSEEVIFPVTLFSFLISFFLPALQFGLHDLSGFDAFWMSLLYGILLYRHFEGIANFLHIISIILFLKKKWKFCGITTFLSLLLSMQTLMLFSQKVSINPLRSESLSKLLPGFYLWVSSFLALFLYCIFRLIQEIRNSKRKFNLAINLEESSEIKQE